MAIQKDITLPAGFIANYIKIGRVGVQFQIFKDYSTRRGGAVPASTGAITVELHEVTPELAAALYALLKQQPEFINAVDLLA